MISKILMVLINILLVASFLPCDAHCQGWPVTKIESLPDSSFALVERGKDGKKIRHLPFKDINGAIDIEQLIYCIGTFSDETWLDSESREGARKKLEEHYYRFKVNQAKEGIEHPVNINSAGLEDLVKLPNIGPVTAVKICRFRENQGPFKQIEDIKKVEGIGPSIFTGIMHYIRVR